ncbi:hypothetical protein ACFL3S_05405 [Gemmatimonadota bacterium]
MSLAISAVVHLTIIFLYPRVLERIPRGVLPYGGAAPAFIPGGTQLLTLEELTIQDESEPPSPEEEPVPEAEVPPQEPRGGIPRGQPGDPVTDEPGSNLSAAERLRPQAGDPRLWAPVDPELTALTEEQILQLQLIAELEALGDSAAADAERARAAMDWTHTDSEGRKWGVSPGKIHLGDITLPMPFGFSAPPSVREANRNRIWEWDDIERGAARGLAQQSLRERAEAIRRRKNAERKADTIRIRR